MPEFGTKKRSREYEKLKDEFSKSGRYKGREKEVAARIVNKQRSELGETKEEKQKDRQGRSPDKNLPIKDYQRLTVGEVKQKLSKISSSQLEKVRTYEREHKNRRTVLQEIDKRMR